MAVAELLEGCELVAEARRLLEAEPGGEGLHLFLEPAPKLVGLPAEEEDDAFHARAVILHALPARAHGSQ